MKIVRRSRRLLARRKVQAIAAPALSVVARMCGRGLRRIFVDEGIWMHETEFGYFAYPHPYLRLNLQSLDEFTRKYYFWGYAPAPGDVVVEIGAGVGEETLTFSRAVGGRGRVVSVEANPTTFRCLEELVRYNRLDNVTAIHAAITEPGCSIATIECEAEYLTNRLGTGTGVQVPATTVDAMCESLDLKTINFLKMNIEGSERLAIRGMLGTMKRTAAVCISCHDFLAASGGDEALRTKDEVKHFLQASGWELLERQYANLPPYIGDQVWACNHKVKMTQAS